jgi:Family of unknown function (DUF5681)
MSQSWDEQPDLQPAAANERVGYRRPPVGTRFRPGQSGNPRGRPKGARNLSTVVAAALSERVAVNENGRRRRITKLEAAVKQLVNRAASGEARATQLLLALVQVNEARPAQQDASRLGDADAIVMAELARRLREGGS